MKRGGGRTGKLETLVSLSRQRSFKILVAIALLYLFLFTLEIPFLFTTTSSSSTTTTRSSDSPYKLIAARSNKLASEAEQRISHNQQQQPNQGQEQQPPQRQFNAVISRLLLDDTALDGSSSTELHESARHARREGKRIWAELGSANPISAAQKPDNLSGPCPQSVSLSGPEFRARGSVIAMPCGLTLGSHVTVVGKPLKAHVTESGKEVSHFVMELQGLRAVDGEEPPRILHLNPRLRGDWSGKPVIEMNTCYRMQWGEAMRCDGWKSRADEDTGKRIMNGNYSNCRWTWFAFCMYVFAAM